MMPYSYENSKEIFLPAFDGDLVFRMKDGHFLQDLIS